MEREAERTENQELWHGGENFKENVERVHRTPLGRKGYGCDEGQCCCYCGKLTLNPKFYGFTMYGGQFDEAPDEEPFDYVGFFPLGPDCARKLKGTVPVYKAKGDDEHWAGVSRVVPRNTKKGS